MPMTKDPIRILAYDAIFPQWAAFEAGLDMAGGGGNRRFEPLHRLYQKRIDRIKEDNPQLVKAVSQALPELLKNLGQVEPTSRPSQPRPGQTRPRVERPNGGPPPAAPLPTDIP